jgi:hypothetical protein
MHFPAINLSLKSNHSRPRLPFPSAVCFVGCIDSDSQLQQAMILATTLLYDVPREEKQSTPGHIIHYTMMQIKSGRRFAGWTVAKNHRTRLASLVEPLAICEETSSEFFLFDDLTLPSRPAISGTRRQVWGTYCKEFSVIKQLKSYAEDAPAQDLRQGFEASASAIAARNDALAKTIQAFKDTETLLEVRHSPPWRNQLMPTKPKNLLH